MSDAMQRFGEAVVNKIRIPLGGLQCAEREMKEVRYMRSQQNWTLITTKLSSSTLALEEALKTPVLNLWVMIHLEGSNDPFHSAHLLDICISDTCIMTHDSSKVRVTK